MNVFSAALNLLVPHFHVRKGVLLLSQGHPFNRTPIDLKLIAAHKLPSQIELQIRLLRGRWTHYSLENFRPSEITNLCALLAKHERQNHQMEKSDTTDSD